VTWLRTDPFDQGSFGLNARPSVPSATFQSERLGSGDGEREAWMTRQIPYEPLPASVLFALGFHVVARPVLEIPLAVTDDSILSPCSSMNFVTVLLTRLNSGVRHTILSV
jgi:hypothetical protein